MQDYEKLGAFYLGRKHDLAKDETANESILCDSRDLTTHAVIRQLDLTRTRSHWKR